MKLISWNVNGVRAIYKKGFEEFFEKENADIFCIQETKMQEGQLDLSKEGYFNYIYSAQRKGYSGTSIWTKKEPQSIYYGIGIDEHDTEGRVITLEYKNFYIVTVYTPNAKRELERLDYRMIWEDEFKKYIDNLRKNKPVIICGDLNVAHKELDVKNDKANRGSAGFTDEERNKFQNLIDDGYVDSFRLINPDLEKFSWWSNFGKAREKNVGWRIDYFLVSKDIENKVKNADIYDDIKGSDHAPVLLDIDLDFE